MPELSHHPKTRAILAVFITLFLVLPIVSAGRTVAVAAPRAPAPAGQATPAPLLLRDQVLSDPDLQHRIAPATPPPALDLPNMNLSFLKWVFLIAGGVVLVVLAVLLAPLLSRYFTRRLRRSPPIAADVDVSTSAEAVERAQDASTAQDYRLALRMLYLASLLKLDEIGALRYDRALTNREYVREVTLQSALAQLLRPVVETFDDVWYGYRPVTPEEYGAFEADVHALLLAAEGETGD
ncbi:MAG: DUF4129 domain-containing protein [Chloroflexi bacterium]|nr:DUF4129 domain-containing protein [Chloroflexota bacterium]MCL5274413.1 DUF4129 domain-containing protein [Chloroflexota bacterium]